MKIILTFFSIKKPLALRKNLNLPSDDNINNGSSFDKIISMSPKEGDATDRSLENPAD